MSNYSLNNLSKELSISQSFIKPILNKAWCKERKNIAWSAFRLHPIGHSNLLELETEQIFTQIRTQQGTFNDRYSTLF